MQQLPFLQLLPESRRNTIVEHGGVLLRFLHGLAARYDGDDHGIGKDELQRRRR